MEGVYVRLLLAPVHAAFVSVYLAVKVALIITGRAAALTDYISYLFTAGLGRFR